MKEGSQEELRRSRLVFYADDVQEIDEALAGFLEASKARCALLIDIEGHLVTKRGYTQSLDTTSIAALAAGSFASTRALAKNLGEREFSVIFHQGENENIHISLISDRCLFVIIFDDATTIGMVRLQASEASERIGSILEEAAKKHGDDPDPMGDGDFQREAEAKLDEFFADEE